MIGKVFQFAKVYAGKDFLLWAFPRALMIALLCSHAASAQAPATLQVTAFTPTFSGFEARFNRPLDTSVLNLYGTETGGLGPADVTLVGARVGDVKGTLVLDASNGVIFVKTAAPLEPDTYTATLRSAANAFRDQNGNLLDGNGDGAAGDDFVRVFSVPSPAGPIASMPDFTYGPGQVIYVPFDRVGLPITLSEGTGVTRVEFVLVFDPNLLRVNSVGRGDHLPADGVVSVEFPQPGVNNLQAGTVKVTVTTPSGFGAGVVEVVRLGAEVPVDAPYRAVQSLYFQDDSFKLNQGVIPVVPDDAVHVVTYVGDTTGNASYSSLDAQRILRVAAGLDTGFAAYPTVDPVLIADITANKAISSLDATRVLQEVAGLDRGEIHNVPAITSLSISNGTVGAPVVIRGSSFVPGNTTVAFNGVPASIVNITADSIETFVPIGATAGQVLVRTDNGVARTDFDVPLRQDFALAVSPTAGSVIQGASTNFTLQLNSTGQQPYTGIAALSIAGLPNGVTASLSAPTLTGGQQGVLTVSADSSANLGDRQVTVTATANIDSVAVARTASFNLGVLQGNRTGLIGQFTLIDGTPMPRVKLSLHEHASGNQIAATVSDAGGNFQFLDVPAGVHSLSVDTSEFDKSKPYPIYGVDVTLVPNQITTLPTFKITPPPAPEVFVAINNATADQVVTNPELPGVSITLPAGVKVMGWDGLQKNKITILKLTPDNLPVPSPPVLTQSFYQFNFGTNMGGVPDKPLPVTLPNDQGLSPGEKAEIYFYDAAPLPGAQGIWKLAGLGTVSQDGSVVVSDPGVGIDRFCGVCGTACIGNAQGSLGNAQDGNPEGGNAVNLVLGQMIARKTDLVLPGRITAEIRRIYNPLDPFQNIAGFQLGLGPGWALSVEAVLLELSPTLRRIVLPGNARYDFARQAVGTFINTTHPRFMGAVITQSGSTHTLRYKDGNRWVFAPSFLGGTSYLAQQIDRNGNTLTIERSGGRNITRIIEPAGRALAFTYAGARIAQIADPIGRTVRFAYNAAGRLETVTNPAGGTTRYTYDTAGRITSITDPRNITYLTNEYDATTGYVKRQTQANGGVWTFDYLTPPTPGLPAPGLASFPKAATNVGSRVTDPRGNRTTYKVNSAGLTTETNNALGQITTYTRDAKGQIMALKDALERVTRYEYDSSGNVTKVTDAAGNVYSYQYEPTFNLLTRLIDPLGNTTVLEYDATGNVTGFTDPLKNVTTIAYNQFGQPTSVMDPLGNAVTFGYDANGNLASISDPLGNASTMSFDAISRVIALTDQRGRTTELSYDPLSQVSQLVDALGGVTQYAYDPNGNLQAITDARGNTTSMSFNALDLLATRIDPVSGIETFQYDALGNLSSSTDRKGQVANYSYDALNRRTLSTYADGAIATRTYDSVGRLAQATDSSAGNQNQGSVLNLYDNLNRMIGQTGAFGTVLYSYDAIGRRRSMTVSGQPVTNYAYDANSRLRQIVQGFQAVGFEYDALGRRTRLTLPANVTTEYRYDPASRITELIYRNLQGVLGNITYVYDIAGNRSLVGGSFARTLMPDAVDSSAYDAANRQLGFGGKQMSYDSNGSLLSLADVGSTTTFTWDARNRLIGLSAPGSLAGFLYDSLGRRLVRQMGSNLAHYIYDLSNPVREVSGSGQATNNLTGLRIDEYFTRTSVSANSTMVLVGDALGSTIAATDFSGVVQTEYGYDPFGRTVINGSQMDNPYQFTGRENDRLDGRYFYRARYYQPSLGRFLSKDPIGLAGGSNLYSYGQNNPLRFTDPYGTLLSWPLPPLNSPLPPEFLPAQDRTPGIDGLCDVVTLWKNCPKSEELPKPKTPEARRNDGPPENPLDHCQVHPVFCEIFSSSPRLSWRGGS